MPNCIDTAAVHTKAFDNPDTEHSGEMFSSCGTRTDNISGQSRTRYRRITPNLYDEEASPAPVLISRGCTP